MRIGSGLKSKTRLCRHFARNACEARLQGASLEALLHLNIPRFRSTESGDRLFGLGKRLKLTIQTP